MLLLNKVDRLDPRTRAPARTRSTARSGRSSCRRTIRDDVAALRQAILAFFEERMVEEDLLVPYAKQALLGEVYENARVVAESYDEAGTHLRVRGLPAAVARLQRSFEK